MSSSSALGLALLLQGSTGVSIWSVGKPQGDVPRLEEIPSPERFFKKYVRPKSGPFAGEGQPVVFSGAARSMPAFQRWSDEYLQGTWGDAVLDQVETEKKETRTAFLFENWTLKKFLGKYNSSTLYSTAAVPPGLSDEVLLLPLMSCGFHDKLVQSVLWMSSGGTKSVIHSDGQENIHCMIAGRKDWIMWPRSSGIARKEMGWVDAEKLRDKEPQFKDAYGVYAGRIDVESVDLARFPGWAKLKWWNMTLEAGDCAFIPGGWFHYVESPAQMRTLSVHVWFVGDFNKESCEELRSQKLDPKSLRIRLSDCTWGYEHESSVRTHCDLSKPLARHAEL